MAAGAHGLLLPRLLDAPGPPALPWSRWVSLFLDRLSAAGPEQHSDAGKRALLLGHLGREGRRLFASLGAGPSFRDAVERLAAHFSPGLSASVPGTGAQAAAVWGGCFACLSGVVHTFTRCCSVRDTPPEADLEWLPTPVQETLHCSVRPFFD